MQKLQLFENFILFWTRDAGWFETLRQALNYGGRFFLLRGQALCLRGAKSPACAMLNNAVGSCSPHTGVTRVFIYSVSPGWIPCKTFKGAPRNKRVTPKKYYITLHTRKSTSVGYFLLVSTPNTEKMLSARRRYSGLSAWNALWLYIRDGLPYQAIIQARRQLNWNGGAWIANI